MNWVNILVLIYMLTCIYYTVAGILVYSIDTKATARKRYLLTKLCLAMWALSNGMLAISSGDLSAWLFWGFGFISFCLFLPSWVDFLYHFTECKSKPLKVVITCLYFTSVITSVLCVSFVDITFVKTNLGYQFLYAHDPLLLPVIINTIAASSLIVFLQIRWVRISKSKWQRRQAIIFTTMTILTAPLAIYTDILSPILFDYTIIPAATVIILFITIPLNSAMRKQRLLNITAADFAEDLFSSVNQPILALDSENNVALANKATEKLWIDNPAGKNITELIYIKNTQPDPSLFNNNFYRDDGVTVTVSGKVRFFSALLSVVRDNKNDIRSKILILNDITDLNNALNKAKEAGRARTEFLAKMSHEIRTPMNAIIGLTDIALREDKIADIREHLYTVKQAGDNLLALVNDILDFSKIEADKMEIIPTNYSLSTLVDDVVNIIRLRVVDTNLQFVVNLDSNVPYSLFGDDTRIRQAVLNLLSNAVKYTENGHVALNITGEYSGNDTIIMSFTVSDTGRGIKAKDLDKLKRFADFTQFDLEKNKGIEGVGLGLAITNSIISLMGGTVNVSSEYGKGSSFTITLPQKVYSKVKVASVDNSEDKNILIYQLHNICASSESQTLENLKIKHTVVSDSTQLHEELGSGVYTHLLISAALYKKCKSDIKNLIADVHVIIVTSLDDVYAPKGAQSVITPVYCTILADLLNNRKNTPTRSAPQDNIITFKAPEAKVLVVDDIATNRKVTQGALKPYEVTIDMCSGGEASVEAVRQSSCADIEHYDIIFMDHKMPGIDGIEATRMIRQLGDDSYFKNVPIIALTANAVEGMEEIFIENSFDGFLSKPIDVLILNAIMEKWIPDEKKQRDRSS